MNCSQTEPRIGFGASHYEQISNRTYLDGVKMETTKAKGGKIDDGVGKVKVRETNLLDRDLDNQLRHIRVR